MCAVSRFNFEKNTAQQFFYPDFASKDLSVTIHLIFSGQSTYEISPQTINRVETLRVSYCLW